MSNLSASMAIFDHLKSTERDWARAIHSLVRVLRFWSSSRSLTPEDTTRLNLVRHDLALRLVTADRRVHESNGRYLNDLVYVGNALMELGPGPIQAKRDKLAAVLGVNKLRELVDRTTLNQSIISRNSANRELATIERRVGEVENVFKTNIWDLETQGIYEELWTSVMDILEKNIAGAQAEASYFDLDVKYRRRIIEILGR